MADDALTVLEAIAKKLGRGRGASCSVVDAPVADAGRNEAGADGATAAPTGVVLPWLDITKVLRVTHGAGVVFFAARKKRAEEPAADWKVVLKEVTTAEAECADPAEIRNMLVKMAVRLYREALAARKAGPSAPGAGNLMGFLRSAVVHDQEFVYTLWCWA